MRDACSLNLRMEQGRSCGVRAAGFACLVQCVMCHSSPVLRGPRSSLPGFPAPMSTPLFKQTPLCSHQSCPFLTQRFSLSLLALHAAGALASPVALYPSTPLWRVCLRCLPHGPSKSIPGFAFPTLLLAELGDSPDLQCRWAFQLCSGRESITWLSASAGAKQPSSQLPAPHKAREKAQGLLPGGNDS